MSAISHKCTVKWSKSCQWGWPWYVVKLCAFITYCKRQNAGWSPRNSHEVGFFWV